MSSALESEVQQLREDVAELKAMLGAALAMLRTRTRRVAEPAPAPVEPEGDIDRAVYEMLRSKKRRRR